MGSLAPLIVDQSGINDSVFMGTTGRRPIKGANHTFTSRSHLKLRNYQMCVFLHFGRERYLRRAQKLHMVRPKLDLFGWMVDVSWNGLNKVIVASTALQQHTCYTCFTLWQLRGLLSRRKFPKIFKFQAALCLFSFLDSASKTLTPLNFNP